MTVAIYVSLLACVGLARLMARLVARRLRRPAIANQAAVAAASWLEGKAVTIATVATPLVAALMSRNVKVIAFYFMIGLAIPICMLLDYIRQEPDR